MDFMPLRLNSSSLTCPICTMAAIILQLVAMECQKLHMVDLPIPGLSMVLKGNTEKICMFNFSRHFKYNCSKSPGESILLKLCQNMSGR